MRIELMTFRLRSERTTTMLQRPANSSSEIIYITLSARCYLVPSKANFPIHIQRKQCNTRHTVLSQEKKRRPQSRLNYMKFNHDRSVLFINKWIKFIIGLLKALFVV